MDGREEKDKRTDGFDRMEKGKYQTIYTNLHDRNLSCFVMQKTCQFYLIKKYHTFYPTLLLQVLFFPWKCCFGECKKGFGG